MSNFGVTVSGFIVKKYLNSSPLSTVCDGAHVYGGSEGREQGAEREHRRRVSEVRREGQRAGDQSVSLSLLQRHRHGERHTDTWSYSGSISYLLHCYSATEHHAVCRPLQESVNTGPFMMRTPCRRCGGRGSIIITHCALCRGTGQTKKRQTVTVPVPAGRFQPGMSDKSTASKLTTHTEDCM